MNLEGRAVVRVRAPAELGRRVEDIDETTGR
jgi:hypothetical protein